jgi:hypothetical protein
VEESTIGMRKCGKMLLDQDVFARDHIISTDILIASLGGNDIALRPSVATALSVGCISAFSSTTNVKAGNACFYNHLKKLFCDDLANVLQAITAVNKPEMIIPCTIYYPEESVSESWANMVLSLIGYNKNPSHIQALIDRVAFDAARSLTPSRFGVKSVRVVKLSEALDGKHAEDYVARVEPSSAGGGKIAAVLLSHVLASPCSLQQAME